jgi:hypothetical protein
MREATTMNKKALATLIATILTLTACDHFDGSGSSSSQLRTSATIHTQGAERFVFAKNTSLTPKVTDVDTAPTRLSLQCESFMRVLGDDINEHAALAPVFEFSNWRPEDDAECEVKDVIATKSDLYIHGNFLNFRLTPESDGGEIKHLNCGILRVPMYGGRGGETECISELTLTADERVLGYWHSSLTIDETQKNVYFSRSGGYKSPLATSLFKYNENEGVTKVLDTSSVEQKRDAQTQWSVSTTDGNYVVMDYFGSLALMDVTNDELKILNSGYKGYTQSLAVNNIVVTSLYKGDQINPLVGSLIIDTKNGQVSNSNKVVDTRLLVGGSTTMWASIPNQAGNKYCLNASSNGDHHFYEYGGSCISLTPTAFKRPNLKTFLESKVGETNYAYVFIRGADIYAAGGGWDVVDAITYIDLDTDTYHATDILSKLDMSRFSKIDAISTYTGGIVVSGIDASGQRLNAYLDQKNMVEYKPTQAAAEIYSPVEFR